MSSGGFHTLSGSGVPELRSQLGSTVFETDRFLGMLTDRLAQHDREHALSTPASEYLKGSMERVRTTLDEVRRDVERIDAEQTSFADREALAMSLDGLSCAVESLTHIARAFDEHKHLLPRHMATNTQSPLGGKTQDSVEKLVHSVLARVHLGFNTLQRSLGQVEHRGDPLRRVIPQSNNTQARGKKPSRERRDSIHVWNLEDDAIVDSFGHEGLKEPVRGHPNQVEFEEEGELAP